MLKVNYNELKQVLGNKFFTVTFIKNNGETRKLNGRLGVTKHLKGGTKSFSDKDHNIITVFDLKKKAYRSFHIDTVIDIKFKGGILTLRGQDE